MATMIQIQDALIARIQNFKGKRGHGMNYANAQRAAQKQLIAKGYTEQEAIAIIRDALDVAALPKA